MISMRKTFFATGMAVSLMSSTALASNHDQDVSGSATADSVASDSATADSRAALATETEGRGFGPQSPRDIGQKEGENQRRFSVAPPATEMSLCDIHFHKSAEHRGGEFTQYAGAGDDEGFGTGFEYDGELTEAELAPTGDGAGDDDHAALNPGDTIEIHFVYSTAQASLGNSLSTCLSDATMNPQLRVESVVGVLVNDAEATDFTEMARVEEVDGLNQAPNLPDNLGTPVVYLGSTTGPSYNEKGSNFQVT